MNKSLKQQIEEERSNNCGIYPSKVKIADAQLQLLDKVNETISKWFNKWLNQRLSGRATIELKTALIGEENG